MVMNTHKDKTALVTGASDGIGAEFIKILASRGYDLILVARSEEKLNDLAEKMSNEFGIRCSVIVADLSSANAAHDLFHAVEEKGLEVNFLINNAGLLRNGFFTELSLSDQEQMIAVNILALTSLTHLYANKMAATGGGHILNVASLAGWMAIPNQNVYAATKAYVLAFTQALSNEMMAANTGVQITALCPGYTATKMMDNPEQGATLRIPASMMMSAREVAEMGIKGCLAGKDLIVPGIANKFTASFTHFFSKSLLTKLLGSIYRKTMD
jgi:short-subunit dehydrogenase